MECESRHQHTGNWDDNCLYCSRVRLEERHLSELLLVTS